MIIFPDRKNLAVVTPGIVIDWSHPCSMGLVYFRLLDSLLPTPQFILGKQTLAIGGSPPIIAAGSRGIGYQGTNSNSTFSQAGGTNLPFAAPATGTWIAYVTAGFSPTDGIGHQIAGDGGSAGGNAGFYSVKFSDSNWYVGFFAPGTDYRATNAATGTFSSGDTFVTAITWPSGRHWVKGIKLANGTGTGVTAIANNTFHIGNANGGAWPWNLTGDGIGKIHWVGWWSRRMSEEEIKYISFNPMCFLTTAEAEMPTLPALAAPSILYGHNIGANFSRRITIIGY